MTHVARGAEDVHMFFFSFFDKDVMLLFLSLSVNNISSALSLAINQTEQPFPLGLALVKLPAKQPYKQLSLERSCVKGVSAEKCWAGIRVGVRKTWITLSSLHSSRSSFKICDMNLLFIFLVYLLRAKKEACSLNLHFRWTHKQPTWRTPDHDTPDLFRYGDSTCCNQFDRRHHWLHQDSS